MAAIQLDAPDAFAKVLVPALLGVPLEASEVDPDSDGLLEFTREARELLRGWDCTTPAGRRGGRRLRGLLQRGVAQPVRAALRRRAARRAQGRRRRPLALRPSSSCSPTPSSAWWDNKLTPNVTEGKDEILRQALVEARLELTRELGKDPDKWQWGKLHRLTLEHRVLGGESVPAPVRWLVNEGP